jgi:hypothetical protein
MCLKSWHLNVDGEEKRERGRGPRGSGSNVDRYWGFLLAHRGTPAVAAEFGTQTSTVYQICCIGEAIGTTCPKI